MLELSRRSTQWSEQTAPRRAPRSALRFDLRPHLLPVTSGLRAFWTLSVLMACLWSCLILLSGSARATSSFTPYTATFYTHTDYRTPAVWDPDDNVAYLIQGYSGLLNVWRYNPGTDTSTKVFQETYLTDHEWSMEGFSAVWRTDTSTILIFGGDRGSTGTFDYILEFDPSNNTVVDTRTYHSSSVLPNSLNDSSAVWDPTNNVAYIFGGFQNEFSRGGAGDTWHDEILKYDPSTGSCSVVAHLPSTRSGTAAAWDSTNNVAYIFGGYYVDESVNPVVTHYYNDIVKFDPATNTATTLTGTLPSQRAFCGIARNSSNGDIYLFGGETSSGNIHDIVTFDHSSHTASTDTATTLDATVIPTACWQPGSPGKAWVFYNTNGTGGYVSKYSP